MPKEQGEPGKKIRKRQLPTSQIIEIPEVIKCQIRSRVPDAFEMIMSAADYYNSKSDLAREKRKLREDFEPLTPVQTSMTNIVTGAAALQRDLATLDAKSRDALSQAALSSGGGAFVASVAPVLTQLIGAAKLANNTQDVRVGRPKSSRQELVHTILNVLTLTGYSVDSSKNGVLYEISEILLSYFRDRPDDLVALIKSAIIEAEKTKRGN